MLVFDFLFFPMIGLFMIFQIFAIFLIPYFYLTSMPDIFPVTVILTTIGILTGGSFNFEEPGKDAFLPPSSEWGLIEE